MKSVVDRTLNIWIRALVLNITFRDPSKKKVKMTEWKLKLKKVKTSTLFKIISLSKSIIYGASMMWTT